MLAEYRKRRDFVVQRLRSIPGVKIAEPKGAFYAYPNISLALASGITYRACSSPNTCSPKRTWPSFRAKLSAPNEHVRISYATSMTELERGLDRIARFISER